MTLTCKACGQPMPDRRGRVCSLCNRPIKRHDKYLFVGSVLRHRDCSDPRMTGKPLETQPQLMEER